MVEYTLQLWIDRSLTDDDVERIYGACDDASAGSGADRSYVMFTRQARTLEDAVASAVRDVETVGFPVSSIEVHRSAVAAAGAPT